MNVFRWVVGGVFALFALAWLLSFAIGIVSGNDVWLRRARAFRHWIYLTGLFWFNVEVWGRVVWTLVHWKS